MTKTKKEVKEKTEEILNDSSFLDKEGKTIKLSDVVKKEDCWILKNQTHGDKWVLTHDAIKRIARIAGISMNYDVEESQHIVPDYRNELEHVVRVTIHCKASSKKIVEHHGDGDYEKELEGCVHSDERELTVTGESNRISTPNRGRGYLRKMAEKRGFDIAVLEHLGLYSSIFSEEESADFEDKKEKEPALMPGSKEFDEISKEINAIINSKDVLTLKKIAVKIKKKIEKKEYSEKQLKFLRSLFKKEIGKKNNDF